MFVHIALVCFLGCIYDNLELAFVVLNGEDTTVPNYTHKHTCWAKLGMVGMKITFIEEKSRLVWPWN